MIDATDMPSTMDKVNYFSQFTNNNIEKRLLKKENLPLLEEMIEQHYAEYGKFFWDVDKDYWKTWRKKVRKKELPGLLKEVKTHIDDFLEIKDLETPKCSYANPFKPPYKEYYKVKKLLSPLSKSAYLGFSSMCLAGVQASFGQNFPALEELFLSIGTYAYGGLAIAALLVSIKAYRNITKYTPGGFYSENSITLKRFNRVHVVQILAHEYAHHVQDSLINFINTPNLKQFREGYAFGIQKEVGRIYERAENNDAFVLAWVSNHLNYLKDAYLWACDNLGTEPKQFKKEKKEDKNPYHSRGYAFFMLEEQKHGTSIYKGILQQKFNPE